MVHVYYVVQISKQVVKEKVSQVKLDLHLLYLQKENFNKRRKTRF